MINLSFFDWGGAVIAVSMIGMTKAGIRGPSFAYVAILALVFGSRVTTGLLLPFMLLGDVFATIYYRKYIIWKHLLKLLPWMVTGVIVATLVGKDLEEAIFKKVMASIIFLSTIFMFWWDFRKKKTVPNHSSFGAYMGFSAGFISMIGGVAGIFANLYFLAMRLPKNYFIGTISWLIFFINCLKIPFYVFVWKTITLESLTVNLYLFPVEILGLLIGIRLVKKINEKQYRIFILTFTAISALVLFF